MKKNISGFSIVIALGLVVLMSLLAVGILEFIIPFSRNNKGIENSSASYYQANSGIENALYEKGNVVGYETGKILNGTPVDYSFDVKAIGNKLPPIGQGNSKFDKDWDIISAGNPIQMEIGENKITLSNLIIAFRLPNFSGITGGPAKTLSGGILPIINWQLSAKNNTLNTFSGNYITADNICESNENFTNCDFYFGDGNFDIGIDLNDSNQNIGTFYTSNCTGTSSGCILKLSIINDLQTTTLESIPYLEWRMEYSGGNIPLRYTIINSEGKSYGFKKSLQIKVPQKTVSEAFDFTVFQ